MTNKNGKCNGKSKGHYGGSDGYRAFCLVRSMEYEGNIFAALRMTT